MSELYSGTLSDCLFRITNNDIDYLIKTKLDNLKTKVEDFSHKIPAIILDNFIIKIYASREDIKCVRCNALCILTQKNNIVNIIIHTPLEDLMKIFYQLSIINMRLPIEAIIVDIPGNLDTNTEVYSYHLGKFFDKFLMIDQYSNEIVMVFRSLNKNLVNIPSLTNNPIFFSSLLGRINYDSCSKIVPVQF